MRLTTKSGEQLQRVLLCWSRARDDVKRRNEFGVRLHRVFDNGREILRRANPGYRHFLEQMGGDSCAGRIAHEVRLKLGMDECSFEIFS